MNIAASLPRTVLACAMSMAVGSANAGLLVDTSFDDGFWYNADTFKEDSNTYKARGNNPKIVPAPNTACEGQKALRPLIDINSGSIKRSEFRLSGPSSVGHLKLYGEYWIGFAIFIPTEWVNDEYKDIVLQLAGADDTHLGETGRNPFLTVNLMDGKWNVAIKADTNKVTVAKPASYKSKTFGGLASVQKGKWTTVVLHTRMNPDQSKGFLKVWINGSKRIDYNGGVGYNDDKGPFVRFGLYKPRLSYLREAGLLNTLSYDKRVFYLDALRLGDASSSLSEVSPACAGSGSGTTSAPEKPTGLNLSLQ